MLLLLLPVSTVQAVLLALVLLQLLQRVPLEQPLHLRPLRD